MNAPLRALLCLLIVNSVCWAEANLRLAAPLEVYFKAESGQSPQLISIIKEELSAIMRPAGYEVRWGSPQSSSSGGGSSALAWIEFQGVCGETSRWDGPPVVSPDGPLGSAEVEGNRVLPFISVNCERLNGMLEKSLRRFPSTLRRYHSGRAAARIIAHELYHVLSDAQQHTPSGITKDQFSAQDLLSSEFGFSAVALRAFPQQDSGERGFTVAHIESGIPVRAGYSDSDGVVGGGTR